MKRVVGAMERPTPPSAQREIEGEWTFRLGDMSLSPEVAGWLVATLDAKLRLIRGYDEWRPPVRARDRRTVADRRAHRDLVIMLAAEIYRRERGSLPPSEEGLVGTYLKSLPDDPSTDPADETPPIVE